MEIEYRTYFSCFYSFFGDFCCLFFVFNICFKSKFHTFFVYFFKSYTVFIICFK
ncbi:conserved protein of unknown function [Listeria monocytogenes]|nr:conserved protein of unknown function [Listeria monocytogenes]GAT38792.1 conserved protein of unknown function [Listeria monocytogenes]GAT40402.1 conserved protein of unknown function [Listeria monocytogenes]